MTDQTETEEALLARRLIHVDGAQYNILELPKFVRRAEAAEQRIATLFDAIKHGDQEHQDWLKKAIDDHFAGRTVDRPVGKANRERIAELQRRVEELEMALWRCVGTFRQYQEQHMQKGSISGDIKARANGELAEICERALAQDQTP